jgi:carbonic anhydrase
MPEPAGPSPAAAWRELIRGNRRFVAGRPAHPHQDFGRRVQTAAAQAPFALVFGCMDSRVGAELVFDRGIGDLAVVRTAGHVIDSAVLGSLEFGVRILGIPLVVVLGHDSCGAISATLAAHAAGVMPGGYVRDIVERVAPSMLTAREAGGSLDDLDADALMAEHVRHTVHLIHERSGPISDAVAGGRCGVVGVAYRLTEGRVHLLERIGEDLDDPDAADDPDDGDDGDDGG